MKPLIRLKCLSFDWKILVIYFEFLQLNVEKFICILFHFILFLFHRFNNKNMFLFLLEILIFPTARKCAQLRIKVVNKI
jgi:hypothetical protein